MKRIFIYSLLTATLFASCRKDDDHVFDKSPDERINETLSKYQSALTGAANGWNGVIRTTDGSTFSFYFRFNESNRVFMFSDFDTATSGTVKESSYRLKALQQPSLIFDTYSYIHILSDPDGSVNGGEYGQGRKSDFEFAIDTATDQTMLLSGRFNGSKLTLSKASAQDRAAWESRAVANNLLAAKNYGKILHYFKRLTYSGVQYEIQLDTFYKSAAISWINNGQPQTVFRGYYFGPGGLTFTAPVVNGSQTVSSIGIGSWTGSVLNVTVNGTAATIAGANAPINPDKNAPARWWQYGVDNGSYWITVDGYHVNGVDDAYGIKTLKTDTSEYYYMLYWPGVNISYDAMAPIFYNPGQNALELYYGTALNLNVYSDGRGVFEELGTVGGTAYPTTGPAATTRTQMRHTGGYWFVQTSPTSYDMVSASDARIWLTWYWIW